MPVPDRLRRARRTERAAALVLVVLAGCGVTESAGSGQPTASTAAAPALAATSTVLVEPGATAPGATAPSATAPSATEAPAAVPTPAAATDGPLGFSNPQVGGGTIDFAALAGQPVALWFWAPT
jgi:hypothetical protein